MATAVLNITINRPVEEVFAYVVDINSLHEWNGVIEDSWPIAGKPDDVGSTYMVKANIMGKIMEIPSEVVGYEPNRLYAYRAEGSMPYVDTKHFEATPQGTRITEHIVMQSEGRIAQLIDGIKLSISKRTHQQNLETLKSIMENEPALVSA